MLKAMALVGMVPWMMACSSSTSEGTKRPLQGRDDAGPGAATPRDSGRVPQTAPGTGGAAGQTEAGRPRPGKPLTDAEAHPTCLLSETSTIPNVHIVPRDKDCVFSLAEARAGISIHYDVVIDQDTPFTPAQPYAYGPGPAYGEPSKEEHHWASALDLYELLEGSGQAYCLCDLGIPYSVCPKEGGGSYSPYYSEEGGAYGPGEKSCRPVTLAHGIYPVAFYWDGVNWRGPSDTGNPKGAPFPAGDYVLTVKTAPGVDGTPADAGSNTVEASARFLVRLVP